MNEASQAAMVTWVQNLQTKAKYRDLHPDTLLAIAAQEWPKFKSAKQAQKSAKTRLHKILADYLGKPDFATFEKALAAAFQIRSEAEILALCQEILAIHLTSRERLQIVPDFFSQIFAITGQPKTLLDLASAINPFFWRMMHLPPTCQYLAYDNHAQFVNLLNFYFQAEGITGQAFWQDIVTHPPEVEADLALFLKTYHCVEQHRHRGVGLALLEALKVKWIAVSFPTTNLSGKKAPILANYQPEIAAWAKTNAHALQVLDFPNEAVLLIQKKSQF